MDVWPAVASGVLAAAVAFGELLNRHPDANVTWFFKVLSPWFYVAVNGAAGAFAFWFMDSLGWTSFESVPGPAVPLVQVLLAGFGGLALLRTSLFGVRVEDRTINIGIAGLLQPLMDAASRRLDQRRGVERNRLVESVMRGVDYQRVKHELPNQCFRMVPTVSALDQLAVRQHIQTTDRTPSLSDHARSLYLGFVLLDLVGAEVLRDAVRSLQASGASDA